MIFSTICAFLTCLPASFNADTTIDYVGRLKLSERISIAYTAGDESTEFNSIEIWKTAKGIMVARKGKPVYFGATDVGNWVKKVHKKERNLINAFITVSTRQKHCIASSSWREHYLVTINKDTISDLYGNCEWYKPDSIYYFRFEQKLFEREFKQLEADRKALLKSLDRRIFGKWYLDKPISGMEWGARLTLTRKPPDTIPPGQACVWIFGQGQSFKNECPAIDLLGSEKYAWDIDGTSALLSIESALWKNTIQGQGNPGATFALDKMSGSAVVLRFRWR
jgi:hypothetical protein